MSDPADLDADLDFEARQLCPDGNCTGLIGAEGRCKLCGAASAAGSRPVDEAVSAAASPTSHVSEEGTAEAELIGNDFGDERQLCPDGNCTGLLGSDGRCKVCGKSS